LKGSGAAETFVELEFNNEGAEVCPIKHKRCRVTGSQVAVFGSSIGLLAEHHTLFVYETGSKLFSCANPATFEVGDEDLGEIDAFKEIEPTSNTGFENWAILES
jgi:hypothetical protein